MTRSSFGLDFPWINKSEGDEEYRRRIRLVQSGAMLAKSGLYEIGAMESQECQYCGASTADYDHIVWECPFFDDIRAAISPDLSQGHGLSLPWAIRLGIAVYQTTAQYIA